MVHSFQNCHKLIFEYEVVSFLLLCDFKVENFRNEIYISQEHQRFQEI